MKKFALTAVAVISAGLLLTSCAGQPTNSTEDPLPDSSYTITGAELIDGPRIDIAANAFHHVISDTSMVVELAGSGDCIPTIQEVIEEDSTVTITYTKEGRCMLKDFRMYAFNIDTIQPMFTDVAIVNTVNTTDNITEQSIQL